MQLPNVLIISCGLLLMSCKPESASRSGALSLKSTILSDQENKRITHVTPSAGNTSPSQSSTTVASTNTSSSPSQSSTTVSSTSTSSSPSLSSTTVASTSTSSSPSLSSTTVASTSTSSSPNSVSTNSAPSVTTLNASGPTPSNQNATVNCAITAIPAGAVMNAHETKMLTVNCSNQGNNNYRYQWKNYDGGNLGNSASQTLSNLPIGSFEFKVEVSNNSTNQLIQKVIFPVSVTASPEPYKLSDVKAIPGKKRIIINKPWSQQTIYDCKVDKYLDDNIIWPNCTLYSNKPIISWSLDWKIIENSNQVRFQDSIEPNFSKSLSFGKHLLTFSDGTQNYKGTDIYVVSADPRFSAVVGNGFVGCKFDRTYDEATGALVGCELNGLKNISPLYNAAPGLTNIRIIINGVLHNNSDNAVTFYDNPGHPRRFVLVGIAPNKTLIQFVANDENGAPIYSNPIIFQETP